MDRASEATSKSAHYKLTSTVMLTLDRRQAKDDTVDLSGSIQRQVRHRIASYRCTDMARRIRCFR